MAFLHQARHSYGLIACALSACLSGCKENSAEKSVTVFVAASLNDVIATLAKDFGASTGTHVVLHAGASGALRKQIELGAPADALISADSLQVEALQKAGKVHGSVKALAQNQLVIVLPGSAVDAENLPVSLTDQRYRRVAIAEPESAPAGKYARQALERAGIWKQMQEKLIIVEDVRAAARYAQMGTVDAAITYRTDALALTDLTIAHVFPADWHDPCVYVGAVLETGAKFSAAAFLDFIAAASSAQAWRKDGFEPLSGDPPTR